MSSKRDAAVKGLSSKILGMKFMQRQHEANIRSQLEEQRQKELKESQWTLQVSGLDTVKKPVKITQDTSYMAFSDVAVGRKSFGTFNKEVEKLASEQIKTGKLNTAIENERRATISDEEMAIRLASQQQSSLDIPVSAGQKRKKPQDTDESPASAASTPEPKRAQVDLSGPGKATRFQFLKPK
ncbi:uncharacterized protein BJ171DRAFT_509741 [Polychytrium aggregatum]|uniref:uncharacterized protein n=1 Tax=Polychytrium aggregatum TaxID=110093 RepID=UPI0022FDE731|nr:uncharacterized protein BJ171DRAFT_509741 [Polychytrium aggregatum]KAI9203483.1 hypothetical protein BJ171DRAFT_509741 [Polychytrium aggregatum]